MKAAAAALRVLLISFLAGVGLEGGFLLIGTFCLAIFAAAIHPAGPWLVVGVMAVLAGLALAIPGRR